MLKTLASLNDLAVTRVLFLGICAACGMVFGPGLEASSVTLAWDASPAPEVEGYLLYYGPANGGYTSVTNVGDGTSATVSGLINGVTYGFIITAYNSARLESERSNEIFYTPEGFSHLLQIEAASQSAVVLTLDVSGENSSVAVPPLSRRLNRDTLVTVTAPGQVDNQPFIKWQLNGIDFTTNLSAILQIDGDLTLNAVFSDNQPVGHWRLNEATGSVAHDSSSYAQHGTVFNGQSWTNGPCTSSALHFDGKDDYIRLVTHPSFRFGRGSFSVALRMRTALKIPQVLLEQNYSHAGDGFAIVMGRPNASPGRFSVSTGEGLWVESKFQDGANGDWHHFAVTYDGVSFRLYRNGKLDVTINRLSNYTFTDAPLHIGSAVGSDLTWPFHGEMDEIRLYDRALSAPEVYALTPCSSTDGLIPLHLETTYLPHSGLSVAIKLRTGAVPDQERLRGVRMLSSDRLDAPMSEWTPVSMAPFLNGATMEASAHAVSDAPQRFYLLVE